MAKPIDGAAWAKTVSARKKTPDVVMWLQKQRDGKAIMAFIAAAMSVRKAGRSEFSYKQLHEAVVERWPVYTFAPATTRNLATCYLDGKPADA